MRNSAFHRFHTGVLTICALAGICSGALAAPFNSGSTGADGAFNPTQNVTIDMPASGIFHYTSVNIPAGVTVTYRKNSANTPVVILASGDVSIAGAIDVSGKNAQNIIGPGAANMPDGGQGGPGGFDGGRGGAVNQGHGAQGMGPGGGRGGNYTASTCSGQPQGGGGAGFSAGGEGNYCIRNYTNAADMHGTGGVPYGSATMLPLVGGSGGGGGAGSRDGNGAPGGGGGGGGGAILLAANGTVTLTGSINASGGKGGLPNGATCSWTQGIHGAGGAGGSGGAVRILATSYTGNGTINVAGGAGACRDNYYWGSGNGSIGRTSIETLRGGTLTFNGLPTISITHVGGVAVPANPTGMGDVSLPANLPNPATVNVAATNVPLGTTIQVVLTPFYGGDAITANSTGLTGSFENSTTTASINIPGGPSVMIAQVSFNLTLAMGNALSVYAQGERVERILMSAAPGGQTRYQLVTVSGKQFEVAAVVLASLPSA